MRTRVSRIVGFSFALLGGALGASPGFAATPSGNLNLRTSGFELITPSGGATYRADVDGIGQLIADTSGNFTGAETYTAVNSALPPANPAEDLCAGTIAGTITAPSGAFASGDGEFTLSNTFTPSASSTGAACFPATVTMLCNRTLPGKTAKKNVNDLDAGEYRCLGTSLTPGSGATVAVAGASLRGHVGAVSGSNAPGD